MQHSNDFISDFVSPCGDFMLVVDDDGKVAYAYLKKGSEIVGDVWLYNRCATPEQPEWFDRKNLPFANCREFIVEEGHFDRPVVFDEIQVQWQYPRGQARALIYLSGRLSASVGVDDKPGFCRFASKDGPLAKVLVVDQK